MRCQDLRQAWARALKVPAVAEIVERDPSAASLVLIGIRMSDATFSKLIMSGVLSWDGTWGSGRLTVDIDRHLKDENDQPLYEVYVGSRAPPRPAPADYPQLE